MMDYIFMGLMIAIGLYLAPVIITAVIGTILGIAYVICRIFGGCNK
jgi:hypothetical protein